MQNLILKKEDLIGDFVFQKINKKVKKFHIEYILRHLIYQVLELMEYFILHYLEKKEYL